MSRLWGKGKGTVIRVACKRNERLSFPESGTLHIEGEQIAYAKRTQDAFEGCTRGVGATAARCSLKPGGAESDPTAAAGPLPTAAQMDALTGRPVSFST